MTLHKGGCKEIHVQLNIFLKSTQYKLTITIGSAVLIAKCSDFLKKATQLIGSHTMKDYRLISLLSFLQIKT